MSDRERRDDNDQRTQPGERDHQAKQEQQVVGAFENVPEAGHDELRRGMMPTRIEPHESRITMEFECADFAARRQESQCRGDLLAEAVDLWPDRELRAVGL